MAQRGAERTAENESGESPDALWLARFHAGDRHVMSEVYATHVSTVTSAVAALLAGPDRENVVHDVFSALIASESMRQSFAGGSLSAWLRQVAKNRALDLLRKQKRRRETDLENSPEPAEATAPNEDVLAQRLIERLRRDCVPKAWLPVFEARFVKQLSQRDAARALGMRRTTLMYQEARVRAAILTFLKRNDRGLFDG